MTLERHPFPAGETQMSRRTLILLAAVCLANAALPATAAMAEPVETPSLLPSEEDGGMRCIAVDPNAMPPVYWYDCG